MCINDCTSKMVKWVDMKQKFYFNWFKLYNYQSNRNEGQYCDSAICLHFQGIHVFCSI